MHGWRVPLPAHLLPSATLHTRLACQHLKFECCMIDAAPTCALYNNPTKPETDPFPPLDNIRVVIVWRLRGNIIRTALCCIVWHSVHSQQHTYMSSSYRSNRPGLSHWDPYTVHRGGCLELYYCNMVEWFWWDSIQISTTSWFPSVLWHRWFGHLACKNHPQSDL